MVVDFLVAEVAEAVDFLIEEITDFLVVVEVAIMVGDGEVLEVVSCQWNNL